MEQIEIEYKILISEDIYNHIVEDYQEMIDREYVQVNHYLMHPILDELKYMVRIRDKDDRYELTLKRPNIIGRLEMNLDIDLQTRQMILNHQEVNNEIFDILKELKISIKDIDTSHYLKTKRIDVKLDEGMLSIDKNEYEDYTDYEIEFEVSDSKIGFSKFIEIIKPYHLDYSNNCDSKVKRMKNMIKRQS